MDIRGQLAQAHELLKQAQQTPEDERLWLLTITWQLLHELTEHLEVQLPKQEPRQVEKQTGVPDSDIPQYQARS